MDPITVRPGIADAQDLERPGVVRDAVAELGVLAVAGTERAPERLRELASPEALDVLFRVALGTSLRRGQVAAAEVGTPAALLELAAAAVHGGALPLSTVADLRATLETVAGELRATGAWAAAAPLWWSPLPAPGGLERLWRELGGARPAIGVPAGSGAREALAGAARSGARRWLAWPGALPAPLLERLSVELAAATAAGGLALRSAGVGRSDRLSGRRNDAVRYLSGLESEVLAGTPTLGVVVQHLLERVEEGLRRLLPEIELHAPQTVMLARYAAPNPGFAAHLDNPGGEDDNGRVLSLVYYLNPPGRPCRGGGLELWPVGASADDDPPAVVLPPEGGSAVLFDARTVPHAVEALEPGPDRWTMVLWLSDRPRRPPRPLVPVPPVKAADVLRAVDDPPVAPGAVLFRSVDAAPGRARITVECPAPGRRPRAGLVATVRGAQDGLYGWCRHHLDLGFDRVLLVLDQGAGTDEAEALEELRRGFGSDRLGVWAGGEAERRRRELPPFDGREELVAAAAHGTATWAVAARQALNATAALRAARSGEDRLDWLVHLDADELLLLEGSGRGGSSLAEHFAAAEAAGWQTLRYLNHELLLPWRPGEPLRFKRNPALAAERLGPLGWRRLARLLAMEQGDRRPYFRAYWNGKGAVAVASGGHAAGVHGWKVPGAAEIPLVAGPSVLHLHLPTAEAFRRKYLLVAGAGEGAARPFPPSPLERAACGLIHELREAGADAATLAERLDAFYAETTSFTPEEIELLEAAGLLFTPALRHLPLGEPVGAPSEA